MTIEKENKTALKEAFDAELLKQLEENPPEIPSYEKFSSMIDGEVKKRRRRIHIISTAASIAILFLAGIVTYPYFAPDIQADKNPKEEIITEDGVIIEDGGWGSSDGEDNVWSTTVWKDVKMAKEIYPDLLVPKYTPEGYTFERLTIETVETGAISCEYLFVDAANNKIEIEEVIHATLLTSVDLTNVIRRLESEKGLIYIQQGESEIATLQLEDGINIYIVGIISDEERIKMINNLTN